MKAKLGPALVALACCLPSAGSAYYEYPTGPVRLVVGAAPGDTNDILARMVAPGLAAFFRRPFIVDNHAGANGNLAAARVAKAPSDGHTLLVVSPTFATSITVYPNLGYHPERSFTPVSRLATFHQVLVVNASLGVHTLRDFLGLVRASPGRITIASAGTWTASHLAGELVKIRAGWLNALHVPYRSNSQALADLMGNHVHAHIATVASAHPHVRTGRLKALAVASAMRVPALADVPTFTEAGLPGVEAATWCGVVAPAGTPYDTVVRLNLAIAGVMDSSKAKQRFAAQGAVPITETPERFGEHLHAEIGKWAKVVKAAGVVE